MSRPRSALRYQGYTVELIFGAGHGIEIKGYRVEESPGQWLMFRRIGSRELFWYGRTKRGTHVLFPRVWRKDMKQWDVDIWNPIRIPKKQVTVKE